MMNNGTHCYNSKLLRRIKRILQETNMTYSIEIGSRHLLIYLNGTKVGTLSKGSNAKNDAKNIEAKIRRVTES